MSGEHDRIRDMPGVGFVVNVEQVGVRIMGMNKIKISEMFYSIQGEGRYTGLPSFFLRVVGCPFRCWWCDTKYSLGGTELKYRSYTLDELIAVLEKEEVRHLVLTGGEPLIYKNFFHELLILADFGTVTVETAAPYYWDDSRVTLWSLSPKLASSGAETDPAVVDEFLSRYVPSAIQLKFVVDLAAGDYVGVLNYLDGLHHLQEGHQVFLQPAWIGDGLQTYLEKTKGLTERLVRDYRSWPSFTYVRPQQHKLYWGERRGI